MKDLEERLLQVDADELSGKLTRDEAIWKRMQIQMEVSSRVDTILISPEPLQYTFNFK